MHVELDKADLGILEVLQQHGSLSAAEVAEKVDNDHLNLLAADHPPRRGRRHQNRMTLLDREKVGLNITIFSRVKPSTHGRDSLEKFEHAVRLSIPKYSSATR